MSNIKSITTVRAYGNGNNGNWVARMRMQDGSELFCGLGEGYTMAQAQAVVRANPDNAEMDITGSTGMREPVWERPYKPLPDGVKIKA